MKISVPICIRENEVAFQVHRWMIFIIGTGKYLQKHHQHDKGNPNSFAALATAKETPKMAFAPKFDLFSTISIII
jgi:hypothetical protein